MAAATPQSVTRLLTAKEAAFALGLLGGLLWLNRIEYGIFHLFAELFSIIVAYGCFLISLNTRQLAQNHYLAFLGLGYFFVGSLDLFHTLVFPGLGLFPNAGFNQPTQFWITARYAEALILLAAPWFLHRRLAYLPVLLGLFALSAAATTLILQNSPFAPVMYLDGQGLTWGKKISEFVISGILLASLWQLRRSKGELDPYVFKLVSYSIGITVASELCFTLYIQVTNLPNVLGHFLKVISYVFIYKAIIKQTLTDPLSQLLREHQINQQLLAQHADALETQVEATSQHLHSETALRAETQQALAESESRLQSILDVMPDLIFILDRQGVYRDVLGNQNDLVMDREVLIGKHLHEVLSPELTKKLLEKQAFLLFTGQPVQFEYELHSNGSPAFFEARMVEYGQEMTLVLVRNVTLRAQAEHAIVEAKAAAERANLAKSNFLATMSHELRTPMNGVLGMAQLLAHTHLTEEQHEYVQSIINSGDALVNVLTDILDLTKIEAKKVRVKLAPFNLGWAVQSTVRLFQGSAAAKGLALSSRIDAQIHQDLEGDLNLLKQVLSNLVANGIKFTDQGDVSLEVKLLDSLPGTQRLRFSVVDTGIGIPPEKHKEIFESFHQADNTSTRSYGGSGLGLSIVTRLVELMGGQVQVDSLPNQGSRFWFDLELPKATSPVEIHGVFSLEDAPVGQELPPEVRARCRILVAEDDPVNQKVMLSFLDNLGYKADLANNGKAAVEAVLKADYHLIFMDCRMPVMDGFEASRNIRQLEKSADIPIIALTAKAQGADRQECLAAGMNDHLAKPLNLAKVKQALERHLVFPA